MMEASVVPLMTKSVNLCEASMQPFVEESKEVPCSEPEVGSASDLPPTSSATTGIDIS